MGAEPAAFRRIKEGDILLFNGIDPRDVAQGIVSIHSTTDDAMPAKTLKMVQLWRGAGYAGYSYSPRSIKVSINIGARKKPKALETARRLVGWAETEKPCPLVLNHEPDKYYMAVCDSCTPKAFKHTFLLLDFIFTAPDPRAIELAEQTATAGAAFEVGGTAWTYPVIRQTLSAQVSGLRYTMDGQKYVELVGNIPAGSVVEIDHAART